MDNIKKVLVIGSGPIKIAEAAEFDYSGSQALKAIKEEGIESILVSPNIATIQTTYRMADKIYSIPVSWWAVEKVIEKELPDGIMVAYGGQSALNVGVDLWNRGIIQKYGIKVLGTPIEGIKSALSRDLFRQTMIKNGLPVPPSDVAKSEKEALEKARIIGYPLMIRVSFNLGGRGSFVAYSEKDLKKWVKRALSQSYINEVLLEKYLYHWTELEYEVVRDSKGNSSVIACIENLDPMGVHTGESVVISPCQTLDNYDYYDMRSKSIEVGKSINLIGESNVQFALDPNGRTSYVIETNPRMSRSSALASKITGYPLAYISAKLALGYSLSEILNKVTGFTSACFEPSLDYIVVKIPRWDLDKFENVENSLGTEMKSVGEVMSIGRNFEEALQKGIRMLDIGEPGIVGGKIYESKLSKEEIIKRLKEKYPYWFLYVAKAFKEGMSIEEIYDITGIDKFYLNKIKKLVEFYESIKKDKKISKELLLVAKKLGFSDQQLSIAYGISENTIREIRLSNGIIPNVKQIDTLAGEFPASTNYLYMTYNGQSDDIEFKKGRKLLILGAGVFRIGVSVEFDWSSVFINESSSKYFDESIVLNYNPETVSTDWDISKKLYFDEISIERIIDIFAKEKFDSIVTFTGAQIGNNIAKDLEKLGFNLYGTSGNSIDIAEDREKFSKLLDKLSIKQPPWISARNLSDIKKFIDIYGFPVIVRPSYVLSGSSMKIVYDETELYDYIKSISKISRKYPVIISQYLENSIEAEIDGISNGKGGIGAVIEHIEEAGIHSGDSTMVIPHRLLSDEVVLNMKHIAVSLIKELNIKGPFNLQFAVKNNIPYVIELNLRASRSMPFTSKTIGKNLMEYAIRAIEDGLDFNEFEIPKISWWGVKSPQFSWAQLKGAYPYLGPEMRSTGEAGSFGKTFYDALLKSWLSASPNSLPEKDKSILIYGLRNKELLKRAAENFAEIGYKVYTINKLEIDCYKGIYLRHALDLIKSKKIGLAITEGYMPDKDYSLRRAIVDHNIPIILNPKLGFEISNAIYYNQMTFFENKEYGAGI